MNTTYFARYPCESCGFDTLSELYRVHDRVWPGVNGSLCVACLESIIDRPLDPDDFTLDVVNWDDTLGRSPLLQSRIGPLEDRMYKCRDKRRDLYDAYAEYIGAGFMAAMLIRLRGR